MLCPQLSGSEQQVWPGSGVDVFRVATNNVRISVVSTASNFLNFERWYIASRPGATSWGESLTFNVPTSELLHAAPSSDTYTESYIDRAVLSPLNWRAFNSVSPNDPHHSHVYTAMLKPVSMDATRKPGRLTVGPAIPVWVQFILSTAELVQIAWYFAEELEHLPSGFEVPEGARFDQTPFLPETGWTYAGGMRPAPWPG